MTENSDETNILTARENQIAADYAQGESYQQIACVSHHQRFAHIWPRSTANLVYPLRANGESGSPAVFNLRRRAAGCDGLTVFPTVQGTLVAQSASRGDRQP